MSIQSNNILIKTIRLIQVLIVCIGFLFCSCQGSAVEKEKETVIENTPIYTEHPTSVPLQEGEKPKINFSKNPSLQEVSDSLRICLSKNALGFYSDLIPMSEEKTYTDGTRSLVRKYDWNVSFPVTVSMGNVLVFPKKGTDKILVTIGKLKIGKRFSFGNENATTISSEKWVTESSNDQEFWRQTEAISQRKMQSAVFNNKTVTNKMRNKAINLVINEINKALAGTGEAENNFEFIVENISY